MFNRLLFSAILVLYMCNTNYGQKQFSDLLFYDVDVHTLSIHHQKTLDSLVYRFFSYRDYNLEIIGHADAQGSVEYNKKIAARRAKAAELYLINAGVPSNKITVTSKGSDNPLAKERFENIKGGDRRVEIVSKATVFANVDDLLDQLGPQMQYVTVDNTQDQNITLKDGTEIFVPANSLVYADGSGEVNGIVTLEVKESYDVIDFVAENLHTKTADEMLQTGGMIYINAKAGSKQVGIKTGEMLDITYPEKAIAADMALYGSVETDEGITWKLSNGEVSMLSSTMAAEELDITVLLDYVMESPVMPNITFGTMPKIPVIPAKPALPQKPQEPKAGVKNYDAKLLRYKKSVKVYEKRMNNYADLVLNYDTVKPRAEAELKMWELEVEDRMTQIKEYEKEMKDYTADNKLYKAITYVQENYGSIPSSELFTTFKEMVYTDIELRNIKDPYAEAFGNFKKQVLKRKKVKKDYLNYNSYSRRSKFNNTIKPLITKVESQNMESLVAKTKKINEGDLDRYMFSVGSFGYHNVDKPIEYAPEEMLELAISDDTDGTKYYVVLKDAQSVISPLYQGDNYALEGLPKNHEILIVGVKLIDSVPHMAISDFNTGNDNVYALDMQFAETNLSGIRTELEALNEYAGI